MAMSVKGQAIPAYDRAASRAWASATPPATAAPATCGYTPAAEIVGNVLGPAEVTDRLAWEGKGKLAAIFQNVHAMTDCLDVCKFSTFSESLDDYAAQFTAMTGRTVTADDLLKVGERVYNPERYYNNLAGFREGSDYLLKRFTEEPADGQGSEGSLCGLDKMLEEYYAEARLGQWRRTGGQAAGVGDRSGADRLGELRVRAYCRQGTARFLAAPSQGGVDLLNSALFDWRVNTARLSTYKYTGPSGLMSRPFTSFRVTVAPGIRDTVLSRWRRRAARGCAGRRPTHGRAGAACPPRQGGRRCARCGRP